MVTIGLLLLLLVLVQSKNLMSKLVLLSTITSISYQFYYHIILCTTGIILSLIHHRCVIRCKNVGIQRSYEFHHMLLTDYL